MGGPHIEKTSFFIFASWRASSSNLHSDREVNIARFRTISRAQLHRSLLQISLCLGKVARVNYRANESRKARIPKEHQRPWENL